ncbi:MAG TPA: DUF503 domain-containing protein [bacterium]|jgi:uncharacterized protein YlxP (DUF503 family)|nr:DUF503 domain-containing protein [Bacillota bacterium]HKM39615.1 DUF503 domain-containing protein [bacterium]
MIVGTLTVEIHLGAVFSLKEKRQVVRSVVDRIRQRFNVSVAEVARQEDHRWAVLGIACVANATNHVDRQLDHILDFLEKDGRFAVVNIQKEIL